MNEINRLLDLMVQLRDPSSGCPWDLAQTFDSIVPHTLEEAYEVADAIARGDMLDLKDELGDLLFQIVFYAQMAREAGDFEFADVVTSINDKMTRRHPHVFGNVHYADAEELSNAWEEIKTRERSEDHSASILDGVALALPALTRAFKLQHRAARIGFDWSKLEPVIAKVEEELREIRQELRGDIEAERVAEEVGDLLFACTNLARHLNVDPEAALRAANTKFETRFRRIETWLKSSGKTLEEASLEEMDTLWERAKAEERGETTTKHPINVRK